jgi:hypothetical protein
MGMLRRLNTSGSPHPSRGKSKRDDEKTVLKELVPMLACLNSSKAGLSGF